MSLSWGWTRTFAICFTRELIRLYSEKPRTIVISTHLIEEAADVIEHVFIIKNGKLIMDDATQNVLAAGYTVTRACRSRRFLCGWPSGIGM